MYIHEKALKIRQEHAERIAVLDNAPHNILLL